VNRVFFKSARVGSCPEEEFQNHFGKHHDIVSMENEWEGVQILPSNNVTEFINSMGKYSQEVVLKCSEHPTYAGMVLGWYQKLSDVAHSNVQLTRDETFSLWAQILDRLFVNEEPPVWDVSRKFVDKTVGSICYAREKFGPFVLVRKMNEGNIKIGSIDLAHHGETEQVGEERYRGVVSFDGVDFLIYS